MEAKEPCIEQPKKPKDDTNKDVIENLIGSFGKYQFILCILIFSSKFPVAFHQMAIIFLSPKVEYTCLSGNQTCPCDEPLFDNSTFSNTIVMQWGLICNRAWMASMTQTLFQLGTLIGSVLFGMASDRFGRRRPLLVAIIIQIAAGIGAAFIPEFWTFTFVRFLIGISVGGSMVTGFVIVMEFVGTKYRDVASALYQAPFNAGHLLLPVFAYFFRDYSQFQLAVSIPTILLLVYFFFVPESPRWLIAVKETDRAIEVLEKASKMNNRPTKNIDSEVRTYQAIVIENSSKNKKGNITDLFRTPNIRRNIIVMAYNWLTCSYCFYGVSQYVGQLSGNIFVNVAASASVTLLGTLLSIPLLKVIGRKHILIIANFICAMCLIILAFVPQGPLRVVLASVGVVTSFIAFVVVYLYCTELFPTVVRNAAIGFSSMMARVGSMVAPFIIDLQMYGSWLPPIAFAILPLICSMVTFLLPETKGCELMTTIEEAENFGNNKKDKR